MATQRIVYKEKLNQYDQPVSLTVYLDGKAVGLIKHDLDGWRYYPRGHKGGDAFPTLAQCKVSLEAE